MDREQQARYAHCRFSPKVRFATEYQAYLDAFPYSSEIGRENTPLSYTEFTVKRNADIRAALNPPKVNTHTRFARAYGHMGEVHMTVAEHAALMQAHGHIPQAYIDREIEFWKKRLSGK